MKIYIGLDDSGRGPVIGPMIISAVAINERQKKFFKKIGVKDSKKLSSKTRKKLEEEIKKNCLCYKLIAISPYEIDTREIRRINLNVLEAMKFAKLINEIFFCLEQKGLLEKVERKILIIVDCPSPNIKRWQEIMERYIEEKVKERSIIIAKHKAEINIAVAAASILAKEEREREIEKIKQIVGFDFGSGYPSDERTISFLKNEFKKIKEIDEKYHFLRKTWKIENIKQKKLKEFFNA
jgi:ribonuclease HII